MEFRLFYRGPLRSNGSVADKHAIRRHIHPQLRQLWQQEPLTAFTTPSNDYLSDTNPGPGLIYPLAGFRFGCLVSERLKLHAELDILFLRPESPGNIIVTGGDIDNRLKTLFDGLRRPLQPNEIPAADAPQADENPFHCLLSDDALISRVTVTTDRLLVPYAAGEVVLIIHVTVKARAQTVGNLGFL
jgi:hypothetical protein